MGTIEKKKTFYGYKPKENNVQKLEKYIAEKTLPNNTLRGKPKSNKRFV
jgi:hypothetical protein